MKGLPLLLFFVFLFSCKKNPAPQGPAGARGATGDKGHDEQPKTGTISGHVRQIDVNNVIYTTGLNTTTVSLRDYSMTTVTDADGNYTLTGVPAGMQEVVLTKPNAGIVRLQQLVFSGNGNLVANGSVFDKADFEFTGGYIHDTLNASSLRFRVYTSAVSSGTRAIAVLFSEIPDIDPEDPRTYGYSYFTLTSGTLTTQFLAPPANNTPECDFAVKPGMKLYANIYPYVNSPNTYMDKEGFKRVAPACGKPLGPPISFVIP